MKKTLTKAEEQIMQALWHLGKAGLKDVIDLMPEPRPHSNTVATLLKIMNEKAFVNIEQVGRINIYYPAISKTDYSQQTMQQITQAYFDGSFRNVVSSMVHNNNLGVDELEALLHELKKKRKSKDSK